MNEQARAPRTYRSIVPGLVSVLCLVINCGEDAPTVPLEPPEPVATTVTVAPSSAALYALRDTIRIASTVLDQNGQVMAGAPVAYSSSDQAVATVDGSGLVTSVGNGAAQITATAGGASGTATVTVAQAVSRVAVLPAVDTVVVGDTLRFSAEALDANGHAVAGAALAWASRDTLVARVDDEGLVTAVTTGEAEITATSSEATGFAALTVVGPVPTTVVVTPDSVMFTAVGDTVRLSSQVRDQIGRPMEGAAVAWASSDTQVATVDSVGLVTASGNGTASINATAGGVSGTARVTTAQLPGSVVVSPSADTIAPGDTLRLVAEAIDRNGHRVAGAEFTWASSRTSVATVDASGLVRGVGEGAATMAAAAGTARGTAEITVVNPDRAVLVALYHATDGPNWSNNENWLTDAPLGDWHGVQTDAASGRVLSLRLWSNNLNGNIPPELGNLTALRSLTFALNDGLTGEIPVELGNLVNLVDLYIQSNSVTGPIPPELAQLENLNVLDLRYNDLRGEVPPQLANLAGLRYLALPGNRLTGPIPPEIGNLTGLYNLELADNALTGPIPSTLTGLSSLKVLQLRRNGGLCVPGTSVFVEWLDGIEELVEVPQFCNEADMAVLNQLYEATGGARWINSDGWTEEFVPDARHGVTADSLGMVTGLDLGRNGLTGELPPGLGQLKGMNSLRIDGNEELAGRLPMSLAGLALQVLHYDGTDLCTPTDVRFRAWLDGIASHEGTGVDCATLSDREILAAFYHATDGPNWGARARWLSDAPLDSWAGVTTDEHGAVISLRLILDLKGQIPPVLGDLRSLRTLDLSSRGLTGPIPPELSNLVNLEVLGLRWSNFTGTIPPELGTLPNLRVLNLGQNKLTGTIPRQLGNLSNLTALVLWGNDLSGPIPEELSNLADLELLSLFSNDLTGPVPAWLGSLSHLKTLVLSFNDLRGPIPEELRNLAGLEVLDLGYNPLTAGQIPPWIWSFENLRELKLSDIGLTGSIPPELAMLSNLTELDLSENVLGGRIPPELGNLRNLKRLFLYETHLSGPIPQGFINLPLEQFYWRGTLLCAPANDAFQAWLRSIYHDGGPTCSP